MSANRESIQIAQVDAFTSTAFAGNPAAVCLVDSDLGAPLMQSIAKEMNLSETAFVTAPDADGVRGLRWFTPGLEVDLCGHATLATAHLLYEQGAAGPVLFDTRSGRLVVERQSDGTLRMDFPTMSSEPALPPEGLAEALGISRPTHAARGPVGQYWMMLLASEAEVAALAPDFSTLGKVDLDERIGVAVTAPGDEVDFVSRFFAPWAGVDEDPVTGSAHCMLGPYWSRLLDKTELSARQIGPRPGELSVVVRGDRTHLIGRAVTVLEGRLSPAIFG